MSPAIACAPPKLAAYVSRAHGFHSLVKTQVPPAASKPNRIPPIPAKRSIKVNEPRPTDLFPCFPVSFPGWFPACLLRRFGLRLLRCRLLRRRLFRGRFLLAGLSYRRLSRRPHA